MKPPIGISEAAGDDDSRWHFLRGFRPRLEGQKIENLKGFARLKAAMAILPNFPKADLSSPLCEGSLGTERICEIPDYPCVYAVFGTIGAEAYTFYVGQTYEAWNRIPEHFPNRSEANHFGGAVGSRILEIQTLANRPIKHAHIRYWHAEQSINLVEHTLLNLTGAICEYRDRKVKSCAPDWRSL